MKKLLFLILILAPSIAFADYWSCYGNCMDDNLWLTGMYCEKKCKGKGGNKPSVKPKRVQRKIDLDPRTDKDGFPIR